MRIAILGAPKTGKTTYAARRAQESSARMRSTDDVISMGWSEASAHISSWFDAPGDWIIEGVAVARALRKWLERNPAGRPVDELILTSNAPFQAHSQGQASMAKGIITVLNEILPALRARGVKITRMDMRENIPSMKQGGR